jgi:hypothetical protein
MAAVVMVVAARRAGQGGPAPWLAAGLMVLVAWAVVWAVYLALDPSVVVHSWPILPEPYVQGLRYLADHDTAASPGFLLGQAWLGTNVWFWPATLLVKLSTPILLLLVAGPLVLVGLVRSGAVTRSTWRQTLVAVILPAGILFVFELPNPRTLGVRYLLPSIALWTVVASPLALVVRRWMMAAGLAVLLLAAGVLAAFSYPASLAWTAPPFTPGYRVATDSNVDWGQDFGLLAAWSRGRHPRVSYFGPRGITVADAPGARPLVGVAPRSITGWVAASATDLTSAESGPLAWLRGYCPVRTLGGSILIYYFVTPPTATAGPATPAALCPGSASHRVGPAAG